MTACKCGGAVPDHAEREHPGLCCDCYDRAWGIDPDQQRSISERMNKARGPSRPITKRRA